MICTPAKEYHRECHCAVLRTCHSQAGAVLITLLLPGGTDVSPPSRAGELLAGDGVVVGRGGESGRCWVNRRLRLIWCKTRLGVRWAGVGRVVGGIEWLLSSGVVEGGQGLVDGVVKIGCGGW